jgi:trehalose 6-phosphate phosphatase
VAELRGIRIVEGKMVVNIVPTGAPNKGTALIALRKRLRCQSAIYVGDDDTDEDVFALASQERLLGIRVGRSRRSRAAYFLTSQAAIDRLLVKLVEART